MENKFLNVFYGTFAFGIVTLVLVAVSAICCAEDWVVHFFMLCVIIDIIIGIVVVRTNVNALVRMRIDEEHKKIEEENEKLKKEKKQLEEDKKALEKGVNAEISKYLMKHEELMAALKQPDKISDISTLLDKLKAIK